jgi:uncharacterized protein DUF3408
MGEFDENRIMKMIGGEAPTPKGEIKSKADKQKAVPKQEIKNKPNVESAFDFKETFLQRVELTDRQPLYLSRQTYEQLRIIVNGIGGNKASMSGYAESIINLHFEQYKEEIIRLFNENIKKPFQ